MVAVIPVVLVGSIPMVLVVQFRWFGFSSFAGSSRFYRSSCSVVPFGDGFVRWFRSNGPVVPFRF